MPHVKHAFDESEIYVKKQVSPVNSNSREAILAAARQAAQSHGYAGLNFRELAEAVGVKHASLYHHFATKADLGAAVAKRYWEDTAVVLDAMLAKANQPVHALRDYPNIFRVSLENDNRLCLCSFMSAEYDDLPEAVKAEVQAFTNINVAWLTKVLFATGLTKKLSAQRANAIYAAVAGAQLMARSRSDISLFDALMAGYRAAGLLPS
jgi:TetR/AcrR family transcriptional repressor of nem operon